MTFSRENCPEDSLCCEAIGHMYYCIDRLYSDTKQGKLEKVMNLTQDRLREIAETEYEYTKKEHKIAAERILIQEGINQMFRAMRDELAKKKPR